MAAGETREPIDEHARRLILADPPRHEHRRILQSIAQTTERVGSDGTEIGIASRQQIRARSPHQVLESLSRHPDAGHGHGESHPACIPLPDPAPQNLRRGGAGAIGAGGSWNEQQRAEQDDHSGCKQAHQDESFERDGLMFVEGVGNVRVGQGKQVLARRESGESIADQGDAAACG